MEQLELTSSEIPVLQKAIENELLRIADKTGITIEFYRVNLEDIKKKIDKL